MKSVIAEATTISKAVEEALKKAGSPVEFFIKVVEQPKSGFLGFGSKNAVIALFFTKESLNKEANRGGKFDVLRQDSYSGLFNNKNLKVEGTDKKPAQKEQSKPRKEQKGQRSQQQRRRNNNNQARKNNNQQNNQQKNKQSGDANNTQTQEKKKLGDQINKEIAIIKIVTETEIIKTEEGKISPILLKSKNNYIL